MKYPSVKGRPSIYRIGGEMISPKLDVIKSAIKTGIQFQNQTSPRYYLVCRVDPNTCDAFLSKLEELRHHEQAEIFLQEETKNNDESYQGTGNYVIKFTGKEQPKLLDAQTQEMTIKELAAETPVIVTFDIMCYYDRATDKYRMTFPIKKIQLEGKDDELPGKI